MKMRMRWEKRGGHVHVRVFAGETDGALGKCGDLVFREAEWEKIHLLLRNAEILPEVLELPYHAAEVPVAGTGRVPGKGPGRQLAWQRHSQATKMGEEVKYRAWDGPFPYTILPLETGGWKLWAGLSDLGVFLEIGAAKVRAEEHARFRT